MPPAPKSQETHVLVDESESVVVPPVVTVDAAKKESVKAKEHKPKAAAAATESDYVSFGVFAGTIAVASAVAFGLHYAGLFESQFWFAVFLVAMTLEAVSPPVHNLAQYLYPIVLAVQYAAAGVYPSYVQLICLVPTYLLLVGVPMSVCLHRYFSHAAFETTRAMQLVLAITSCFAYQGGALWWSAKHNRHHHHCDQPNDPHSVVQKGYFYAFMGWTMNPKNTTERDFKYNNPALFVPELQFLDKYYHLPVMIVFTILEALYGRPFVVYSVFGPMLVCRLVTLLFNVEYHPAHDARRCKSINDPKLLAVLVGESDHEIHHRKPALCKRSNLDLPYWLTLFWMEPIGLVWNCR